LNVLAVVRQQTENFTATPALTTFEELIEIVDIVPGKGEMPQ